MSAGASGLDHYNRLFGAPPLRPTRGSALDKSSLPTPHAYLRDNGLLIRKPKGDWTLIRCPSHKGGDERNPSMSISLVDGHFACHACGAKGRDILALHRLRTGLGFRDAVRDLGGRFHE
jgi:hypothetical protein